MLGRITYSNEETVRWKWQLVLCLPHMSLILSTFLRAFCPSITAMHSSVCWATVPSSSQLTLLLFLVPSHSPKTGLSQMKPSISMTDLEAPQIINLLKCFLLTKKSSYWSSRLIWRILLLDFTEQSSISSLPEHCQLYILQQYSLAAKKQPFL